MNMFLFYIFIIFFERLNNLHMLLELISIIKLMIVFRSVETDGGTSDLSLMEVSKKI